MSDDVLYSSSSGVYSVSFIDNGQKGLRCDAMRCIEAYNCDIVPFKFSQSIREVS